MSDNIAEILSNVNNTLMALQDAENTCVEAVADIDEVKEKVTAAQTAASNADAKAVAAQNAANTADTKAVAAREVADAVTDIVDAAKAVGQIGDAIYKPDTDLNTLIQPGNYYVGSGSNALNIPAKGTASIINVYRSGNNILQDLDLRGYGRWSRRFINNTWENWTPGAAINSLTLYVSKTGSDANTGMEADYPVLTINRALQIARGLLHGPTPLALLNLRIGSGNWGEVSFSQLPFQVHILPYNGETPTAYSDDLPKFGKIIVSSGAILNLTGINADQLHAANGGVISVNAGYKKIGRMESIYEGLVLFKSQNAATNILEHGFGGSWSFKSSYNGRIIIEGYLHLKLMGNNEYANGIVMVNKGGIFSYVNGQLIIDSVAFTHTGPKFVVDPGGMLLSNEKSNAATTMNSLPGTAAGIYHPGAIVNGFTIGQTTEAEVRALIASAASGASLMSLMPETANVASNAAPLAMRALNDAVETDETDDTDGAFETQNQAQIHDQIGSSVADAEPYSVTTPELCPQTSQSAALCAMADDFIISDEFYWQDAAEACPEAYPEPYPEPEPEPLPAPMPDIISAPLPTQEQLWANLRIERNLRLMACDAQVNRLSRKLRRLDVSRETQHQLVDSELNVDGESSPQVGTGQAQPFADDVEAAIAIIELQIDAWDEYAHALCALPDLPGAPWDGGGQLTPWPQRPDEVKPDASEDIEAID